MKFNSLFKIVFLHCVAQATLKRLLVFPLCLEKYFVMIQKGCSFLLKLNMIKGNTRERHDVMPSPCLTVPTPRQPASAAVCRKCPLSYF